MPPRDPAPPLRWLVVGCGSIGTRHINNLRTLGADQIVACDVNAKRRQEVADRFGISVVRELDEAWEYQPTVALITVPTSLHVPVAMQAAEHGCHLFIEKPLSDRVDGALHHLLKMVRDRQLVSLVGCNFRFHPTLRRVKQLCEEGAIGHVVAARAEVGQYLPDWHPWEDYRQSYSARRALGGGVILDAIHEIDYIRWLMGAVEAVASFASKLSALEIETEDTAAILLRFVGGAIGEVHLDYIQRASSRTCHIIGEQGTIRWDYTTGEMQWYSAETGQWRVFTNPESWKPNQMYVDELQHFLRCVVGAERPAQDLPAGVHALHIALAAKRSAEQQQVITLAKQGAGWPKVTWSPVAPLEQGSQCP